MEHPRCAPGLMLFPNVTVWDAQSLGEELSARRCICCMLYLSPRASVTRMDSAVVTQCVLVLRVLQEIFLPKTRRLCVQPSTWRWAPTQRITHSCRSFSTRCTSTNASRGWHAKHVRSWESSGTKPLSFPQGRLSQKAQGLNTPITDFARVATIRDQKLYMAAARTNAGVRPRAGSS